jgi:hypothetical protein
MKPVAIFRHFSIEGPGYLATFLDAHAIPWRLVRIDTGEALPSGIGQFSGRKLSQSNLYRTLTDHPDLW